MLKPGWMRNIKIVPYDPSWPIAFATERDALLAAFAGSKIDIHHIGSTSVPGLCAKPLIDILLVAADHAEIDARDASMTALGYLLRGELGIPGRRYFSKGADDARTHHVHAYPRGHAEIARHLDFRDYLRSHPAEATRYGSLKQQLARAHRNDIDAYMHGKAPLIKELLAASQQWRADSRAGNEASRPALAAG